MNTILIYISEVLVNFIEAGLFIYLVAKNLEPKEQYAGKVKSINTIWTLMLVFTIVIVNILKINGTYGFLIFLIMQILFTFWFMKEQAAEKLLWSGIYITADLSADVLSFFISIVLTSKQADLMMYSYPYRFLATGLYAVLLIIYILMLCRLKKREIIMPKWSIYAFTAFIVSCVTAVQVALDYSIEYSYMLSKWQVYGIYAIMMVVIAAIAIFITVFISFGGVSQEKEVLKKENKLLEEKIERVNTDSIYYTFKIQGLARKADLKNVEFINSDLRRIHINMLDGCTHTFYGTLDDVFQEANEAYPYFIRINKSYVVNRLYIKEYTLNSVFIDGMKFKISRKYLDNFRAVFE